MTAVRVAVNAYLAGGAFAAENINTLPLRGIQRTQLSRSGSFVPLARASSVCDHRLDDQALRQRAWEGPW